MRHPSVSIRRREGGPRRESQRQNAGVEGIDIRHLEVALASPSPASIVARENEVEELSPVRKLWTRLRPAIEQLEPQRLVELHGTSHVMRGERQRRDCFDHASIGAAAADRASAG